MAWLKKLKSSKNWYIAWRLEGKAHLRSTRTQDKRVAEKIQRQVEQDLALGLFGVKEHPEAMTLQRGVEMYLEHVAQVNKYKTVQRYRLTLRDFCAYFSAGELVTILLEDLSRNQIEGFFTARRKRGLSDSTVSIDARQIRAFGNWAFQRGLITKNFVREIPRVRVERDRVSFLSINDLERLLAGEPREDLRELFCFLILTGSRIGETCALTWGDIRGGLIYFRAATTKNGKPGEVEIYPALQELLEVMRQRRGMAAANPNTHLWPFSPWWASRCFKAASQRIGLAETVHLHCLRHTAAAHLLTAGLSLYDVSKILRHSSTAVTEQNYGHLVAGHLAAKMEQTALAKFGHQMSEIEKHNG